MFMAAPSLQMACRILQEAFEERSALGYTRV
jgi:hypothetical protein